MGRLLLYHNGECSKSKGALELLQDADADFDVRWYLTEPLSAKELTALLQKLGIAAHELVRKSEPIYKERFEGRELSEAEWISAMVEFSVLIERPILQRGDKAIICRPPDRINELL